MSLIGIREAGPWRYVDSARTLYDHVRVVVVSRRTYPVPRPHEAYDQIMGLFGSYEHYSILTDAMETDEESVRRKHIHAMEKLKEGGKLSDEEYVHIRELGEFLVRLQALGERDDEEYRRTQSGPAQRSSVLDNSASSL